MTTTQNLVVNGGCETGSLATDFTTWVAPSGWTLDQGQIDAEAYAAGGSGDLNQGYADANGFGNGYFSGGPNAAFSSAYQTISLGAYASKIDAGGVTFDLAGEFGGYAGQDDHMACVITFYAADGTTVLGSADTIGNVTALDRGSISELLHRSDSDAVPVGARFAKVELEATRSSGNYNDGYADNISLTLSGNGLTNGILTVTKTHDYSAHAQHNIDAIQFAAAKNATATFAAEQFGAGKIAADGAIIGDTHDNTLKITIGSSHAFDGSALTFESWNANKDAIVITGTSAPETIVGTVRADTISGGTGNNHVTGGGGGDLLKSGANTDTFIYGAVSDSASMTRDTIDGFHAGADFIDVTGLVAFHHVDAAVSGTLSDNKFDKNLKAALDSDHLGKNDAVLFTGNAGNLQDHVFLVVDGNHHAGYQAGEDIVIELTNGVNLASFSNGDIIG